MNTKLTAQERLLLAILQLHPGSTIPELYEHSGSRSMKYMQTSLRSLLLAGLVVKDDTRPGTTYKVSLGGSRE